MKVVEAQYDMGVLRPLEPLSLRPGERVDLIVMRRSDPARWDLAKLAAGSAEDLELTQQGLAEWADMIDAKGRG